jgi:zinc transport system substrate-binding protein
VNIRMAATLLSLAAFGVAGCSNSGTERQDESNPASRAGGQIVIYVVNYPLKYFAERIGGDRVVVELPAPPDVDPAFWNPGPETIVAYQNADLILLNGAAYAKWTARASLPQSKVVDTSGEFSDRYIVTDDAVTHSHGPGGEHAHTGTAFTTWLDFHQAALQARAIKEALAAGWPDNADAWDRGYSALEQELMELDTHVQNSVAGKQSRATLASHPVYQYLVRRYGLNVQSVLWEPDAYPSESGWRELARLVEEHPAGWMIWEGDPLPESVKRLEEMGVTSVVFDPCGNVPEDGDFATVMRQNMERIKTVYR